MGPGQLMKKVKKEVLIDDLLRLEAIMASPSTYQTGGVLPVKLPRSGGRSRDYPDWAYRLWNQAKSIYKGSRGVEAAFANPIRWTLIQLWQQHYAPHAEPLPDAPMKRYHWAYARERYLLDDGSYGVWSEIEQQSAAEIAVDSGLCNPDGPGSLTHPDPTCIGDADGKVVTPLFKAKPGDKVFNKKTGEVIREKRFDPDAHNYTTGGGEQRWGVKHVLMAVRGEGIHHRVIVASDAIPPTDYEVNAFMRLVGDTHHLLPGLLGWLYDKALRGSHADALMTLYRLLPLMATHAAGTDDDGKRVEREGLIQLKKITGADGVEREYPIYHRGGDVCIGDVLGNGEIRVVALTRRRTKWEGRKGAWRLYNIYDVPDELNGGSVRIRVNNTAEDRTRGFNRSEYVRAIPENDPDFERLGPQREDIESINRALDDTLWLRRAQSVGHRRQRLDLLGFAGMMNALTRFLYGQSKAPPDVVLDLAA